MFGGTPSNLAISIMNGSNIEVIAAVNLPMLIKLTSVRETSSLEQAVIQAKEAGRKYICVASQVLDATPDRVEMAFGQVAIGNHDHSEGSVMVSVLRLNLSGACLFPTHRATRPRLDGSPLVVRLLCGWKPRQQIPEQFLPASVTARSKT
jgi:hypothetical protein